MKTALVTDHDPSINACDAQQIALPIQPMELKSPKTKPSDNSCEPNSRCQEEAYELRSIDCSARWFHYGALV